jgi:hypothetical protein
VGKQARCRRAHVTDTCAEQGYRRHRGRRVQPHPLNGWGCGGIASRRA